MLYLQEVTIGCFHSSPHTHHGLFVSFIKEGLFLGGQNCGGEVALDWKAAGIYLDTEHWTPSGHSFKGLWCSGSLSPESLEECKDKGTDSSIIDVPKGQTDSQERVQGSRSRVW